MMKARGSKFLIRLPGDALLCGIHASEDGNIRARSIDQNSTIVEARKAIQGEEKKKRRLAKRDANKGGGSSVMKEGREPIVLTVQRERGNGRDKEVVTRGDRLVSTQGMAETEGKGSQKTWFNCDGGIKGTGLHGNGGKCLRNLLNVGGFKKP